LELAFSVAKEGITGLRVLPEYQYKPREEFFCARDYAQFGASEASV
jgi:hypothetical protein